jgi:uncharacterized membrane protein YcaP (DUF421 family)
MIWSDLVVPGVPLIEKLVRPLIVYAALIFLLRLFGKRELAQLNPYDLVVLLMISNTVQNAIIGNDNSVTGGLLGALTLLLVNLFVVRFLYRHEKIDRLIEGNETVLVENGKVIRAALDRELITLYQLEEAAHKQGFEALDQVERCILEPGGTLAMFGKRPTSDDLRQREVLEQLAEIRQMLVSQGARGAT